MKRSHLPLNVPVLLAVVFALLAVFLLAPMSNVLFAALRAVAKAPGAARPSSDPSSPAAPAHSTHAVTVTFNYDFGRTPACTPKIQEHCTDHFVVYDISAGVPHRTKLFTIPVPEGAKGLVKGISAASPKMDFESGQHQLAVTAQEPNGTESPNFAATVWIVIP